MSLKKDKDGNYYQPNPLRQAKAAYDKTRYASWQPEYEKLNITPIPRADVSGDFAFRKPSNRPVLSKGPKVPDDLGSALSPPMRQNAEVQGMVYQAPWETPSRNIEYENVPTPPQNPFQHQDYVDDHFDEDVGMDALSIKNVEENEYCVFISEVLFCSSPSKNDIEDVLNKLVFEKNVLVDEIIVMKKLKIKIGANLDD